MTPFAYRKAYPLPGGFALEFSFDNGRLACEWSPDLPKGRHAKRLLPHYRNARDKFLASLSADLGVNVAVVEV